jgi:CDP-glucose 4,6-dehydratase
VSWDPRVAAALRGRRVLVTGHTGFKGAWLALWLERLGAEVCGLSLPPDSESLYARADLRGHWTEMLGDIRDEGTVKGAFEEFDPEIVLHLAAQPLVSVGFESPLETFATNVMGTAHVLDAARESDTVRGCVIITTDKVYRPSTGRHRHSESDPLGGRDPYSASKSSAEHVVDAWRLLANSRPDYSVVAARAGNVIGGGDFADNRLVPDLIRAFSAGEPARIRHPNFTRPWQHVLDPLAGYLALAARIAEGQEVPESLNFGPDREEPVSEIADLAVGSWGGEASWVATAADLAIIETPELALDSTLAADELGWRPSWSTPEAVGRTVSWWSQFFAGADPNGLCLDDITAYERAGGAA